MFIGWNLNQCRFSLFCFLVYPCICFLSIWSSSYFLMQFVLPHILGWDQYTNQSSKNLKEDTPMVDPRVKNLEWDRWIAFRITSSIFVAGDLYLTALEQYGGCSSWELRREKFHFVLVRGKSLLRWFPLKFKSVFWFGRLLVPSLAMQLIFCIKELCYNVLILACLRMFFIAFLIVSSSHMLWYL